jgi:putative flavoprotein involved in K+ transport
MITPNATIRLPGGAYVGDEPDAFMRKDEIIRHFERWAGSFRAPVREGVTVTSLEVADGLGFTLQTSDGAFHARSVVVCTGAYQRPHRPSGASSGGVVELDADAYTNEAALPPGKVLVVGSGQTGCQIAEELHEAGRVVVLSCGRAPWAPRRLDGRDIFFWLIDAGFFDLRAEELPSPAARLVANVQTTGHDGGHDLNYRVLRAAGVTLAGHFLGAEDGHLHFASDLADSVAFGDARYADLRTLILDHCVRDDINAPELPDPPPFDPTAPERLGLDGFGTILYTSGFRPDYATWMQVDAFDDMGFPVQENGRKPDDPRSLFLRRPLPSQAEIVAPAGRRRGRGDRRRFDRRASGLTDPVRWKPKLLSSDLGRRPFHLDLLVVRTMLGLGHVKLGCYLSRSVRNSHGPYRRRCATRS